MKHRVGVDLGGTKIEICVLDMSGNILYRERVPTPKNDYARILNALKDLVNTAQSLIGFDEKIGVGIGIPGAVSPRTGLIKNSNTLCLIGKPLAKDLELLLHRPVRLANDANCFALSEATDGVAQIFNSVFGVILGTGCGGGLVFEKKIIVGGNAIAGEWGHCALAWPTEEEWKREACYCGKRLCNELYLSGTGIEKEYFLKSQKKKTVQEIHEAFHQKDAAAMQTLELFFDRIARALSQVINVFDPEAIVLGGGVSNMQEIYSEVPARLQQYAFSDGISTRLLQAKYGDSSGVRGAAWLFNSMA
ncbi:MAG: ROK family protein [Bdellovibrionales bacterium]